VRDQSVLDRVSREAKSHIAKSRILETMPESPHSKDILSVLNDPDFHIFYHAPVLILISATAAGPYVVEDCALAAENLMLTAYAAGLGTCWIGFAQIFLNTASGKAVLGLSADCVPVAPIIVGHPKVMPASVPRKESIVRWIG
jgi:nitroreductase